MALTATATHKVRADVTSSLAMRAGLRTFQVSFYRGNLGFRCVAVRGRAGCGAGG